uniref:Cyclin N-terminal domain-containing protein n=1 Tax=Anopheles coluzzii TaxID=1518534 RepID=A0A8W7P6Z1_ANOCL
MAPQGATATVIVPSTTSVVTPGTGGMVANIPVNNSSTTTTTTTMAAASAALGFDHLSCQEIIYDEPDNRFADPDRHMITDDRVLPNLIRLERYTIPPCNYFVAVQQDIKPAMRKIVTTWMLELLGCCTLLLASKIRQCQPLTVDVLSAYTDHAVSPDQIRN